MREVGTEEFYTYPMETVEHPAAAPARTNQELINEMVRELIEKVADKWTMIVLECLEEHGRMRFTRLGEAVGGVSQKMLTKTLRQMESDGLVRRTIHSVIPPHVEYELTDLGLSLGEAFCPLWTWVQSHYPEVEAARARFKAPQG